MTRSLQYRIGTDRRFAACMTLVLTMCVLMAVPPEAPAQVRWQITGADANINGIAFANELPISGPTGVTENCAMNGPFQPSVMDGYGVTHGFGAKCYREAKELAITPAHTEVWVQSVIKAFAFIDGDNSNEVTISWLNLAYCDQFTDGHVGDANMNLTYDIDLEIGNGPIGEPVLVHYYWDAFGGADTDHECPQDPNCIPSIEEDPVLTQNTLSVGGNELLANRFNFASPGSLPGWNSKSNQHGTILAHVGDTINISLDSMAMAHIQSPEPQGTQTGPEADADFRGTLRLTVGYALPPEPPPPPPPVREFSLDIGSDTEISDPFIVGNEYFDPGDVYAWGGPPIPVCGVSGLLDDASAFTGIDMPPTAPDCGSPPISAAPICAGGALPMDWFDLDGTDSIDFSLIPLLGQLPGPIPFRLTDCIFAPMHLAISYDDDSATQFSAPAGTCSVPTNSQSPNNGDTFGTTQRRDEVLYVLTNANPATATQPLATPLFATGIADEMTVHPALTPNPDTREEDDDDVDALDIVDDPTICNVWCFSPDSEATSFNPLTGAALDGGDIYEVANGLPVDVVRHGFHLGLPDGVDIDAFEFAWLYSNQYQGNFLAMLFSVDDDDPTTPLDESGGLDPAMIYASFMDGISFPYLTTSLDEDVDAITVWKDSLLVPTMGACCMANGTCQLTLPSNCSAFVGTFLGAGTDCSDANMNGQADVCECHGCRGDMNGDHKFDGRDVQPFMNCFVNGPGAGCGCADIDGDANIDNTDLQLFVYQLLHGPIQPCP